MQFSRKAPTAILLGTCLILVSQLTSTGSALQQQQQQQQQQQSAQQPEQAHQQQAASFERQARAISNSAGSNVIEPHSSSKSRLEAEKRQIQEFLTTKNIFKSIVKLLFGNQEEISATSRHVLGILGKVLDLLKNTFGQKSRSQSSGRKFQDIAEEVASAGVTMLQGYVKSVLAQDDRCVQRYLCESSKEVANGNRELGYIMASVGGYASSYLLDGSKSANFKTLYEASQRGRSKDDCAKIYADCQVD